jgi:hypothetical protein
MSEQRRFSARAVHGGVLGVLAAVFIVLSWSTCTRESSPGLNLDAFDIVGVAVVGFFLLLYAATTSIVMLWIESGRGAATLHGLALLSIGVCALALDRCEGVPKYL